MAFKRLSRNVIPTNYDILIEPKWNDVQPVAYKGKVVISVEVGDADTKEVLLNSVGASLTSVTYENLNAATSKKIEPLSLIQTHEDIENELLRLIFRQPLGEGKGELTIDFGSQFCDAAGLGMKGMYRSKYNYEGHDKFHYLTFFAPTYARNAFPCFDEPDFKATFDIALVVPPGLVAASNMPLKSEESFNSGSGNLVLKKFDRTPKMSTYLAAWMIGEFDCLEESNGSIPVRVFSSIGKKAQCNFALNVARKALNYFDDYFGIPYPLPKLDLAAFGDFPCGAMENWGLITFRETVLLIDEKESSVKSRLHVGTTTCHEVAHSWFGNYVTMKWWTDLWLNEGFATFMQTMCYDAVSDLKSVNIWEDFLANIMTSALQLDSLGSSHPIEVEVNNPSDIDEIFDNISYLKGASIIAMLHDWLGDSSFKKGMSKYLKKFQYANAETKDLWAELEAESGKPVGSVMGTWTQQMGYPLINVKNVQRQKIGSGVEFSMTLEGELFRLDRNSGTCLGGGQELNWEVPLTFIAYSHQSGNWERVEKLINICDGGEKKITIEFKTDAKAFKVNGFGIGFYRVAYQDEQLFDKLKEAVMKRELPSRDRLNLLNDLFAATMAGHSDTNKLLDFLSCYKEEDNYFVWSEISEIFCTLMQLFAEREESLLNLRIRGKNLFSSLADRLGWDPKETDSPVDVLLRSLIITRMVEFGEIVVIDEGKNQFEAFVRGEYQIPADLRSAVYKAFLSQNQGQNGVDRLLKVFRETDLLEEKLRVLNSMEMVKDAVSLKFLLDFSLSEEVRSQDAVSVMRAVSKSCSVGRQLTWTFFKDNWQIFQQRFTGLFIIGNLVKSITQNFSSKQMEEEVDTFFKQHFFRGTTMTVQQCLESVRINRAWLARIEN